MKLKLTQAEIDKLVVVERVAVLPTVYGVGCNDVQFQIKVDGKIVWQYQLWKNMLGRCFDAKFKQHRPTYEDVTCCDDWLSFANFFSWVNKEVGYSGKPEGTELDKDLIISGNKTYSPEACSFVPDAINTLVIDRENDRGKYPVGVFYHKRDDCFRAQVNCDNKRKWLGNYSTPEDAFAAYKVAKEAQIKIVATQYKDVLSPAVYESLMNWEIEP